MDNETLIKGILGACNSINALKRVNMTAYPMLQAAEYLMHQAVKDIKFMEEYKERGNN